MRLVIIGSEGNVGRRLMAAFPGSIGIDAKPGATIVADLATIDYDTPAVADALKTADGVVHLATSANPGAPDHVHFTAVVNTARLVAACEKYDVLRLVLPS